MKVPINPIEKTYGVNEYYVIPDLIRYPFGEGMGYESAGIEIRTACTSTNVLEIESYKA